ncbi:MAG: M24 family metallopeptidase [Oscillospiraceae bacterium]|jgi:Xaa-Pro aminopeptidase
MNHFRKIQEKLSEYGIDAMLITGEANRFYASGFHSTGTDGVALVTSDVTYYFTDSRYIEAANHQLKDAVVEMTGYGQTYLTRINDVIQRHGIETMGFEEAYMTVAEYERYRSALHCDLMPATALLSTLRMTKDAGELEAMVAAQRISERALTEILNDIRPGVTEQEIAAKLQYRMLCYGASDMSFDPIVVSGPNGSMPHGVPGSRKMQAGDFVTMDFGCVYGGYCSDMTRTVAIGYVTEEMEQIYHTVLQAQLAGIAAARSGVSGRAVDAAGRDIIAATGYGDYFGHGFGHGVGVEIHELPNASPAYDKPLLAGAVISAEPGIYLPGKFGVRIEDVVVITDTGCKVLTDAPKDLMIL